MTLCERVAITRAACEAAVASAPMSDVRAFLLRRGMLPDEQIRLLRECAAHHALAPELTRVHEAVTAAHIDGGDTSAFARTLLVTASLNSLDSVSLLPVDDSVRHLFCKEFCFFANPGERTEAEFDVTQYPFLAMAAIALLDRFPGGQQQWEVSGFPRSWLAKTPVSILPRLAWFFGTEAGGLQPFFVSHMAVGTSRSRFLLERDYRKSFFRMAAAIEKQPQIKAIMGASWLHSRETHRVSPHLAFLNNPHLESGGIYADAGEAPPDSGFLSGDKRREELYRSGIYKPTIGVVICTREQAIEWKRKNQAIESSLLVP